MGLGAQVGWYGWGGGMVVQGDPVLKEAESPEKPDPTTQDVPREG